jgi:alcohol-forming fatty acyl-CoA reductase
MVRIQTRISQGLEVLQFFTMREWIFKAEKSKKLIQTLSPSEYEMFFIDSKNVPDKFEDEYLQNCLLGGRQYVFKEPLSSIPRARIQMKM